MELPLLHLGYNLGFCLNELIKTTKNLSQNMLAHNDFYLDTRFVFRNTRSRVSLHILQLFQIHSQTVPNAAHNRFLPDPFLFMAHWYTDGSVGKTADLYSFQIIIYNLTSQRYVMCEIQRS
jgi:hypothetical protein